MTIGFLEHIREIPDRRMTGTVTYPRAEILLSTLAGVLRGAAEFDPVELLNREYLAWLRQFLPYRAGIPHAQTFRKVFRLLKPAVLEQCFASWVASLQDIVRGVVAVDGKTLRGSKKLADGSGALHLLSAYACEAGLVIGQSAVNGKSNEIKAISELLEMLAIKGAIVSIDAIGTQTAIAGKIAAQQADDVLALKGNRSALHDDVKRFFEDAKLAKTCAVHKTADAGHGRIEERTCRATDVIGWLQELHPDWRKLRGIAAITSRRIDKTTGQTSVETRVHWGIANRLHWQLDVTFEEDRCRTRKDFAPLNLAIVRHIVLTMLKRDTSKLSLKRKRLKASVNPDFRAQLLAC